MLNYQDTFKLEQFFASSRSLVLAWALFSCQLKIIKILIRLFIFMPQAQVSGIMLFDDKRLIRILEFVF